MRIHIIINPVAGVEESILPVINSAFHKKKIDWTVSVTTEFNSAYDLAKKALRQKVDLIVAYGGDGTVMDVAQALFKSKTPMAILPGGSANVMAKELGIPTTTKDAVELLAKKLNIREVDMGMMNNTPFLIRINVGLMADIVKETPRDLKLKVGQLAYTPALVKHTVNSQIVKYSIRADGKRFQTEGVCMVIANSGNVGLSNTSLVPSIRTDDGKLDLIVIKNTDVSGLKELAKTALLNKQPEENIQHWKVKHTIITVSPQQTIIMDDIVVTPKKLNIRVIPKAIRIVVP